MLVKAISSFWYVLMIQSGKQVSEAGRPGIAQPGVMRMTTNQGYPAVSTISEDELDEMVSEESQARLPGDDSRTL